MFNDPEVSAPRRGRIAAGMQANEHALVLKALEPVAADRKCFRLIGGVLVEQNVGLVKPSVQDKSENLQKVPPPVLQSCAFCQVKILQLSALTLSPRPNACCGQGEREEVL